MLIHIAAINHFDPLCRAGLLRWLGRLSNNKAEPTFLAVEWGGEVFLQVRAQRDRFRQLLREQWPQMLDGVTNALVLSLAYEGDNHSEIFPDVDVLWLDEQRQLTKEERENITYYAADRLNVYREFLGLGPLPGDDDVLARISESARREAGPPINGENARDELFAQSIMQRIGNEEDGWAIIIVGRNHALDADGSMRRLLENAGQRCEVTFL